ncbi:MAG: NADH-quinone oxidoreductase subunit NuoE [Betaproteobacteria bacterium]|nr:NADH-quinone oxidoreductase subunit NuoE [Betaproteobacteria bacterium]MBL8532363.1 NADH-quinone oxidoreductase subunit NuoE [Betaproteobacteria bacterium]
MNAAVSLSEASRARIDRELTKYPADQRQSAVMSALAIVQEENGHLTNALMDAVAEHLGMPPIAVYEVATFYSMYDLSPVGTHKLCVCTNLPCALSGANEAAEHLKKRLGIGFNGTTADGRFTLKEGECFGACGDAPVILQNNRKMLVGMTASKIDELLAELAK